MKLQEDKTKIMETRDHSKNGANPKSQTSRGDIYITTY